MGQIINGSGTGVDVTWKDSGFAFNPYPVQVSARNSGTIRFKIDPIGAPGAIDPIDITIDRDVVRDSLSANTWSTVFDISSSLQLKFADKELGKVEQVDTTLVQTALIYVYIIAPNSNLETYVGEFSVRFFWGAEQIGGPYSRREDFIYWPGLPFTVPLLIDGEDTPYYWYERYDEGTYTERGEISNGKYNLDISSIEAKRRVVFRFDKKKIEDWPGIFTKEFDHTFRSYDDTTFFVNIDVADCVEDGVYLRWIGPYGRWNYFNFHILNKTRTVTNKSTVIESRYDDVNCYPNGIHPGTGAPVGKEGQDTVTVVAPLIKEKIFDYVWTLPTSPLIYKLDGMQPGEVTLAAERDDAGYAEGLILSDGTINPLFFSRVTPIINIEGRDVYYTGYAGGTNANIAVYYDTSGTVLGVENVRSVEADYFKDNLRIYPPSGAVTAVFSYNINSSDPFEITLQTEAVTKWVRVDVVPGSFARSKNHLQDLTFTINLPKTQLQSL